MPPDIHRILDGPIIHQGLSESLGNNINGPSLIRVPDWVRRPLGRYYLYFAHHEGRSIRLAHAEDLSGPWRIHEAGALQIEASLFPADEADIRAAADVAAGNAGLGVATYRPHIASPDVLIDAPGRRVLMYLHGMVENGDQKTRLAVSSDGVRFEARPPLFDHYYFRAFRYAGQVWVLSWGGYLYRAAGPEGPFERGPALFEGAPLCPPRRILRHLAVLCDGARLHLFFSRIGDAPEVILHVEVRLSPDWAAWQVGTPREILRPVAAWEGAALPVQPSRAGVAPGPEHALRDPCVFRDEDGRIYLLYCGAAEQAIGIVELRGLA